MKRPQYRRFNEQQYNQRHAAELAAGTRMSFADRQGWERDAGYRKAGMRPPRPPEPGQAGGPPPMMPQQGGGGGQGMQKQGFSDPAQFQAYQNARQGALQRGTTAGPEYQQPPGYQPLGQNFQQYPQNFQPMPRPTNFGHLPNSNPNMEPGGQFQPMQRPTGFSPEMQQQMQQRVNSMQVDPNTGARFQNFRGQMPQGLLSPPPKVY